MQTVKELLDKENYGYVIIEQENYTWAKENNIQTLWCGSLEDWKASEQFGDRVVIEHKKTTMGHPVIQLTVGADIQLLVVGSTLSMNEYALWTGH